MKSRFWRPDERVLVVTRHPEFEEYLREQGLIPDDATIREHVTNRDVVGYHVIGKCPLTMAAHALSLTEVPLDLKPRDRGGVLTLERLREVAGSPERYKIIRLD